MYKAERELGDILIELEHDNTLYITQKSELGDEMIELTPENARELAKFMQSHFTEDKVE